MLILPILQRFRFHLCNKSFHSRLPQTTLCGGHTRTALFRYRLHVGTDKLQPTMDALPATCSASATNVWCLEMG